MICQSCKKPKKDLTPKRSALMPSASLLLCNTCFNAGYEPRHVVVIACRSNPDDAKAKRFIKQRLYVGDEITAAELV